MGIREQQRFIAFWCKLSDELLYYIIRKSSPNDAEDILQDIAILGYKKFYLFQNKGYIDFKRWVYGVASNKIMKWRTKTKKAVKTFHVYDVKDDTQEILEKLFFDEEKEILWVFLCRLSTKERQLIKLRDFDELSYKDIAMIMGKSKAALMTMHTRILKKLFGQIRNYENSEMLSS